ncbi:hypothetical protein TNCV_2495341 [Trichonephila clavipes]|nr:hypothetical protein TNCV_2495341 [Trichonephila clavipes]
MSVQRFLKLEEALALLNILDSNESDFEIVVLPPDASELIDEDEGDENETPRQKRLIVSRTTREMLSSQIWIDLNLPWGCDSPVIKVSDHGRHV